MNNITLTQIVKNNPEETRQIVLNPKDILYVRSMRGKTIVKKSYPTSREYIVKETEDEVKDMIENAYSDSQQPQYDFNRDLSITIKLTDTEYKEIEYSSDEYDYIYYDDKFLVIIKDNIVLREISIGKIICVSYNKKEQK